MLLRLKGRLYLLSPRSRINNEIDKSVSNLCFILEESGICYPRGTVNKREERVPGTKDGEGRRNDSSHGNG
jgi:hypothetical protein